MAYNTEAIKQANDLRDLAGRHTVLRRESHDEMAGPCPKCGGADRFHCKADLFFCRQCHPLDNGKAHDLFGFYEWLNGWDFLTTCKALAGDPPTEKAKAKAKPKTVNLGIPDSDDLQTRAMQIAIGCAAMLWEPEGQRARAWLNARGLADETLKVHLVGFNSKGERQHGFYVPRGITIPHWQESANTISGIKVRLSTNGPDKYRHILGSRPSLYLADHLAGHDVAIVCEGEFDALLLHQEAGDLVGVCGLGSAGNKTKALDAGLPYLLHVKRLLVATDNDAEGEQAAAAILERTQRARRLHIPQGNDVTDYWKEGGDLRAWVSAALADNCDFDEWVEGRKGKKGQDDDPLLDAGLAMGATVTVCDLEKSPPPAPGYLYSKKQVRIDDLADYLAAHPWALVEGQAKGRAAGG